MKSLYVLCLLIGYLLCLNIHPKTNAQNNEKFFWGIDTIKKRKELLNVIVESIHKYTEKDFCIISDDSLFRGFSIIDLVDTNNIQLSFEKSYIYFVEKHIYHYSYIYFKESYSQYSVHKFVKKGKIVIL